MWDVTDHEGGLVGVERQRERDVGEGGRSLGKQSQSVAAFILSERFFSRSRGNEWRIENTGRVRCSTCFFFCVQILFA